MPICVRSETGTLEQVLLHRPGAELEQLVPGELERLLFDDIPYLQAAQQEHDAFAEMLRHNGTQVLYLEELMAQTLAADPQVRRRFVRQFIEEGGRIARHFQPALYEYLTALADDELVRRTMTGVSMEEFLPEGQQGALVSLTRGSHRFVLDPIPNLYFTRDPFACIGEGVSLNAMYSPTRRRETIYGQYILKYHPDFAGQVPFYYRREDPFSIEGGDILNLSPRLLAVGISQRTTPEAIEILARNIFRDETAEIRTILALDIPNLRAFMHLDTVLTQVDRDTFTVHPEILGSLRVYRMTSGGRDSLQVTERTGTLEEILAEEMGLTRVKLIRCGGGDRVASEREQWNDGSNTLCIAPGKVVVYDRNYVTNAILRDNGIQVLEMPSSELSRGRGGPRCMSMPLRRAAAE
ncbi:MAG: arginine deiminase [Vescimonas sp.]